MRAEKALHKFISLMPERAYVLDIGPGAGEHSMEMESFGMRVWTCGIEDAWPWEYASGEMFDGIWCSHVLEHSRNPGKFLDAIWDALTVGGWAAITVPPAKHQLVGGHVTLWNMGLLMYHLVLAGFDCRDAWFAAYDYDLSVMVRKDEKRVDIADRLVHDNGDIEVVAEYMPGNVWHGMDGRRIG